MEKKKLKIDDLPTTEEIIQSHVARQLALSKKTPNAENIIAEKTAMTYSFLFQNYPLIENQDKDLIFGTLKKVCQTGFFAFLAPVILNINLAKITGGYFFELPKFLRFSIRTGIYLAPLWIFGFYAMNSYQRISLYMVDKYMDRVELFIKIGDPRIMNPYAGDDDDDDNPL